MPVPTFVPLEVAAPRARTLNRTQAAARLGLNGPGVDKLVRAGMLTVPIELEEVERLAGRRRLRAATGELTVLRTDARAEAYDDRYPHDPREWVGFHVEHTDAELADSSLRWWRSDPARVLDNVLFAVTVSTFPVAVYAITGKIDSFQRAGEAWLRHHYAGDLLARAHPRMVATYRQDVRGDLRELARQIMTSRIAVDSGGPIGYLEPAPPAVTTVEALAAFTRIRETAETYMEEMDALDLGWSEETVTDVCVHKGHPTVSVCKFNKNQEGGGVGADYLWWWLDRSSGVCFGMLVQAKRLTRQGSKWKLDISHNNGKQYSDLLKTATRLEVAAMYGVYTGGPTFRAGLACFHDKQPQCLGCRRMAISMVSAYQMSSAWALGDAANYLFNKSIPLEDLVDPSRTADPVHDLNLSEISAGELRDFLLDPQVGPREVAKRIFRPVSYQRRGMFSRASAELIAVPGAPLFPDVPEDTGHYPGSYFQHFLRGLRHSPPRYVEELLERQLFQGLLDGVPGAAADDVPVPAELVGLVDGVVLISL